MQTLDATPARRAHPATATLSARAQECACQNCSMIHPPGWRADATGKKLDRRTASRSNAQEPEKFTTFLRRGIGWPVKRPEIAWAMRLPRTRPDGCLPDTQAGRHPGGRRRSGETARFLSAWVVAADHLGLNPERRRWRRHLYSTSGPLAADHQEKRARGGRHNCCNGLLYAPYHSFRPG